MKADFDSHSGTFLLYPTRQDVWRKNAEPIAKTVLDLVDLIGRYEPTVLGVLPHIDKKAIESKLTYASVVEMDYNDIWIRDSGAVPCTDCFVKFGFNAWGGEEGLYRDWSLDATVPEQMSRILQKPLTVSPLTVEGGNLLSNGQGTLVAIKKTLYNKNRNPDFDHATIESILLEITGAKKLVLVDEGLAFDETGGHIDNLCAFADSNTLMLAWTDDKNNPQYDIVRKAWQVLSRSTDAFGNAFDLIKVPLPAIFNRTIDDCEGLEIEKGSKERFPQEPIQPSYINFVFVNGGVILPTFDDDADEEALKIFKKTFPEREVITFPAREVTLGGGGIHCITKNY